MYGPVVPSVYNHYAHFGADPLESTGDEVLMLKPEEEELFQEVYKAYSVYSAIGLMNMTHKEAPWRSVQQLLEVLFQRRLFATSLRIS